MPTEVIIIASDSKTEQATRLMAETLPLFGYNDITANCEGFRHTDKIQGALKSYAPSIFAEKPKPLIVDVAMFDNDQLDDVRLRWQLFFSAKELYNGYFHIVIPTMVKMGDGEPMEGRSFAQKVLKSLEISADKIWEL